MISPTSTAIQPWKLPPRSSRTTQREERPEIKRRFIKLYHENYNEKGSVFRIAKKDDKYFLAVKVRKRREIVIPSSSRTIRDSL